MHWWAGVQSGDQWARRSITAEKGNDYAGKKRKTKKRSGNWYWTSCSLRRNLLEILLPVHWGCREANTSPFHSPDIERYFLCISVESRKWGEEPVEVASVLRGGGGDAAAPASSPRRAARRHHQNVGRRDGHHGGAHHRVAASRYVSLPSMFSDDSACTDSSILATCWFLTIMAPSSFLKW